MTTARLAIDMRLTVLSTTRNPNKIDKLKANGVDHVIIDDGDIDGQVRELYPDGVDRVLELIGTKTLLNSLKTAKRGGIVCMTGILGGEWTLANFTPMEDIPTGVKLTAYAGEASNLSQESLQAFVDDVASGHQSVNLDRVFKLEELVKAHRYLESNQASGKIVVVIE